MLKRKAQGNTPSQQIANYLMKMRALRELIEQEERNGNKIAEAVYRVRFVRIAAMDVYGDLAIACRLLKEGGMDHSARFIATLIKDQVYDSSKTEIEYAEKFILTDMGEEEQPVEETVIIDTRTGPVYELSCIVSIFREGKRAAGCLRRIMDQSVYKNGNLEIIFVDSNSPDHEDELFRQAYSDTPHLLYLKTSRTEKLPAAWNRGVAHSLSELVTFAAPSNILTENAFEILLCPFRNDSSIVLTQGDIGQPCIDEPPALSIAKADLQPITMRRADAIQQIVPFFFINYLAFDCCIVKKEAFKQIGGFDDSFMCAAENKLHLNILSQGPIQQVGEMMEGAFEEKGPRLTIHPRIEIEHFQAVYEAFSCEALVRSAKQDPAWGKKSDELLLKDLISLSLKYPIAYRERMNYKYYDLEKARSISQFALLKFPHERSFWNDHGLLNLRLSINQSLLHLSYAAELEGNRSFSLNWNITILRFTRWLLSFTFLFSHHRRVREIWTVGTRSKYIGTLIGKLSQVFVKNKMISPDIYGKTLW